jgi:hypothetical protein
MKFCLLLTPNGAVDAMQVFIGFLAPIADRVQQKTHTAQKNAPERRRAILGAARTRLRRMSLLERSTYECRMLPENLFTAREELIAQSVDLVRLIGRDILLMQRSQLVLGGLVIEPVVDWPRPLMKRRRILSNPGLCQD